MLEPVSGTSTWRPRQKPVKTSGVYFGSLKTFIFFVKLENTRIGPLLNILLRTRNIRRIDIFVHVTCYPETMPMSRIAKKPWSVFKAKQSNELKTGQQISV